MRHENWPHLLRTYLNEKGASTFAWGTNDCCSFVCGWIQLCTGQDVYAEFRNRYTSELGAYRIIREVTGNRTVEAVAEYVAAQFGMESTSVLSAQRGDVVLSQDNNGQRLGLVSLIPGKAVFLTDHGFMYQRVAECQRAWKVQ